MTAVIDYDAGNIKSVEKALCSLGEPVAITRDKDAIRSADRVILPGVGAFGDAMGKIRSYGLDGVIHEVIEKGTPFLGICLGLQLLFESSEESPEVEGLGILKGKILRIPDKGLKVPHIGWNSLNLSNTRFTNTERSNKNRLFEGISEGAYVYFVHSYYLQADEPEIVTATTDYAVSIHASVEKGNVFACQFHPEKSSEVGLHILRNFIAI